MRKIILTLSLLALLLFVVPLQASNPATVIDEGEGGSTFQLVTLNQFVEQLGVWSNEVQQSIFGENLRDYNSPLQAEFTERLASILQHLRSYNIDR